MSKDTRDYTFRISRLTIDKLGVKLYDRVSAVVAELIANSYDADADHVTVRLPLATSLMSTLTDTHVKEESGYFIEVVDDGHGMTPDEAIDHYLEVGQDRRQRDQGGRSRTKKRAVMGRKGIGKLAPFGICKRIEVMSAGGNKTPKGYVVSHFFMDYEQIVSDSDKPVVLARGKLDRTYSDNHGTTIRLSNFLPKRVPDSVTFHRQLAARFVFAQPDFEIFIEDTRDPVKNPPRKVDPVDVPVDEGTRIDLGARPVKLDDGSELPVVGWLAMAKNPYKFEEMAGVRIYARNKIVATTRDFEQPAGFTGEFAIRSYLVGEVCAEWLDLDDGEDLIRSDRQSILWDSDFGRALRKWGAELIKEIGRRSQAPRRARVRDIFFQKSNLVNVARQRYSQTEVVDAAIELGKQIGGFASEDELENQEYVEGLAEIILSVAPHKALIEAFREFSELVAKGEGSSEKLLDLFGKTRIAETAALGQVAVERVRSIQQLEQLVRSAEVSEDKFQQLIAKAPWLIDNSWTVITANQPLKTFKKLFEDFWFERHGERIELDIGSSRKRPDFTLADIGRMLHIVEIKPRNHVFDDTDFKRLQNYIFAFEDFFQQHNELRAEFSHDWRIDLIADSVSIRDRGQKTLFNKYVHENRIWNVNWRDFLTRAVTMHEALIRVSERFDATTTK